MAKPMSGEVSGLVGTAAAASDRQNALKWFVPGAGAVLAVTGVGKVWTVFGGVRLLVVADPITGIPFRWLLLAVGVLELVFAGVCFLTKNKRLATLLVAWLATNFLVYRLGLWWMGWHRPCGCMGKLTDALHISEQTADNIMKVVLAYLFIGSYGLLLWQWRRQGQQDGHRHLPDRSPGGGLPEQVQNDVRT